ncbi:MAG TPA: glycosyltransferase [Thermoanaerobaculia bacterium]|jgi:GT2 family glycosyltransferase/glycosyltransferase involved in cell wall biosynthesis|nr:glycosyltransferase [Thermoanaerobaculia bacterium]
MHSSQEPGGPAAVPARPSLPDGPVAALARWLGRRPLPLAGDPRRVPPDGPPGPVDVVVPIYGAAEELGRCLLALSAHTDLERHRLVLVLDGPPAAAVAAVVAESGGPPRVHVVELPERGGFVTAVNRGMAESSRDVVLLNSDTQVTAGWLEKLQRAAYSAPEIATATPFSNSATICSLPRFLEANALPAGWNADGFARLVERCALPAYPRLPTGVGVCLYVKRKALAQLGAFDRRSFGFGYGEESEFCMRALKAGYAHVLDDATFIFHEGHRSFGPSRRGRVAAAHRRLARLHPEYLATVARFLRDDPLAPLRERVVAALVPPRQPASRPGAPARVLHVVHGWPPWSNAGTELYAAWLARRQARHREVTVFSRIADPARDLGDALELLDGGARVRLLVRNFDERDPRSRNSLASRPVERDFDRLLDEARPQLVHVHHLAGHAASLPAMVRRRGIPLLYQVQDWWTPCARANLCDRSWRLCSGPAAAKCAACLPLTGLPPAAAWNFLLYRYRAAATRRALRCAGAYVMASSFIRDSYLRLGLLRPDDPVYVLPYGIELTPRLRESPRPPGPPPLRFGVIGSMLPHKGIHVAVRAFAGVDPGAARLTLWGDPAISPAYARELAALGADLGSFAPTPAARLASDSPGLPAVTLAGPFEEERKAEVFAALDVLIVPSLGLESFGLVAREAMHHGVPVLASRRGALAELFPDGETAGVGGAGALFEPGDAADLRRWIDRLIAEPALLAGWRRRLPPVKSADEHAAEIEEIYLRLLAGSPPGRGEAAR